MEHDVDERFRHIERRLNGNGAPPEFVRADVYNLTVSALSKDLGEVTSRLSTIIDNQHQARQRLGWLIVTVLLTATGTIITGVVLTALTSK